MSEQDISAIIANDMRSVGFAVGGEACLVGRFKTPISPKLWRESLLAEWPAGVGAVHRAIQRMQAAGHEYEGNFVPYVELDPSDGQILGPEVME
jgi:hypothetical protein